MSDIERYLSRLRTYLGDLDPKRAEEIVTEARSHLEARAAQLYADGMEDHEATAKAAGSFGDPRQVARELLQGNTRHRRRDDRVALALLLAFAGFCGASALMPGPPSWLWNSDRWLAARTFLVPNQLGILVSALLASPVAILAGLLAGKHRWWIAGFPPVICGGFLAVLNVLQIVLWRGMTIADTDDVILGATLILVAGPFLAACGLLGSRLPRRGTESCLPTAG